MTLTEEGNAESTEPPAHVDVRIAVENFGPIEKAEIDLRPLTIFVGASNTGKTFFSVLVYSLHNTLEGFSRIPVVERQIDSLIEFGVRSFWGGIFASDEQRAEVFEAAGDVVDKLSQEDRPFRFSDLPTRLQKIARETLLSTDGVVEELVRDLRRCFDLASASGLIRAREGIDRTKVSLRMRENNQDLWRFDAAVSASGLEAGGEIEDMDLVPARGADSETGRRLEQIRISYETGDFHKTIAALANLVALDSRQVHYLPAARSGIMQSHRVIASSAMALATRTGLERSSQLSAIPGPLADFMRRLIDRKDGFHRTSRSSDIVREIAGELENGMLGGEILVERQSPDGYPEFRYRPRNATRSMGLGEVSSMVAETAPMVLFLRDGVAPGDTLIVEEPEAHLHPAAQTEVASALARLVNAGVRVVVTTHSDWLLKEFGNLIREGEFSEKNGRAVGEPAAQGRLRPEDVGVWLFRKGETGGGSTVDKIPFDRVEGIEPSEYEDVAQALYNRSAELQDRLAEADAGGVPE